MIKIQGADQSKIRLTSLVFFAPKIHLMTYSESMTVKMKSFTITIYNIFS